MGKLIPQMAFLAKRADRAVVSRLLCSVALIDTRLERLRLMRESLQRRHALRPYLHDTDALDHRLARIIATYYKAEGRLIRNVQAVGNDIDRYAALGRTSTFDASSDRAPRNTR